jgi:dynactin complex subunit
MKVDINVPESLNEITLYQYQKFEKLIQDNEASHFVNQKTIEIFCNIELKDVARIRIADIDDLLAHLNNLLQAKPKLTRTFKLGVYEFGFIPKLEDMTSGEFIDLENYLSNTETLHQAMAVLYRPITSKVKDLYTIEEYESSYKYSEVLKYMPLDIALGSMLFFGLCTTIA